MLDGDFDFLGCCLELPRLSVRCFVVHYHVFFLWHVDLLSSSMRSCCHESGGL